MQYVIEYDIAAIVIVLAVMLGFFRKKVLSTVVSRDFSIMGAIVVISAVLDIITIYYIERPTLIPLWAHYVINIAYHIPYNLLALTFYSCFIMVSGQKPLKEKREVIQHFLLVLPAIIVELLIVTTPITHLFFYFDEELNYRHGYLFCTSYICSSFYLGLILLRSIKYRKELTKNQRESIWIYLVFICISLVIQLFFPDVLIVGFVSSLGVMLVFLSLEDPADYTDKVLQTYNRKAFELILKQVYLKKRPVKFFALQVKNLDNINESIGYRYTDRFLKTFTSKLINVNGRRGVYRLSGSKFVFILPSNKEKQKVIIDTIKDFIKTPFQIEGFSITPNIAMTVYSYPDEGVKINDIIPVLENTLIYMPESQFGLIVPAEPLILQKKNREFDILQLLKDSIINDSFNVVYQPIYNVAEGKFTTAEALIRLCNSENIVYSPNEFIPVAEKYGVILEIGKIVFKKVCEFISESNILNHGIKYIHVNLSVIQCMQNELYDDLLQEMNNYNIPYSAINFEVTESAAIVSNENLRKNMNRLIEKGCEFSMDDYGSGYSNTMTFVNFPFTTIKMDKVVIYSAMKNKQTGTLLKHIISIVKSLNMKVVAEGVETKEEAELLTSLQCDYIQGYYYSRPISGKELKELVIKAK